MLGVVHHLSAHVLLILVVKEFLNLTDKHESDLVNGHVVIGRETLSRLDSAGEGQCVNEFGIVAQT